MLTKMPYDELYREIKQLKEKIISFKEPEDLDSISHTAWRDQQVAWAMRLNILEEEKKRRDNDTHERVDIQPIRYAAYDDETDMIRAINSSISLLSSEERAKLERSSKRGDKLAAYIMIGVVIFFAVVALLARAS